MSIALLIGACGGGGPVVGSPASAFVGKWSLVSGDQAVTCGNTTESAMPAPMSQLLDIDGAGDSALTVNWTVTVDGSSTACTVHATASDETMALLDMPQACNGASVVDGALRLGSGVLSFDLTTQRDIAGTTCMVSVTNDFS